MERVFPPLGMDLGPIFGGTSMATFWFKIHEKPENSAWKRCYE